MPTSPNPDPARKAASSVSSALSSSASKAASAASAAADAPTSELLRTVASEVRSLVQGELTSARQEITGKVLRARPAMAKLGAAAVLGAMAAGTSGATLVRALDRVLPRTASALAATALLGGAAAALATAAREELRRIGSPVPEQTVQSVKEDIAAVAEATSTS
jgi:Putative Actinobacterial Holin-X, holin superfamily III